MGLIKDVIFRLRGEYTTEKLVKMGMKVGTHFNRLNGVILDPSHCWLIDIGNNVTMAPRVHVICHDASTKMFLGYTKIGRVTIGDNVFIGADTVILPGVTIGSNVIIGANSTVTKSIPDNSVAAGSPANVICTCSEYIEKERTNMKMLPCYSIEYTLAGNITEKLKDKQKTELKNTKGFIV